MPTQKRKNEMSSEGLLLSHLVNQGDIAAVQALLTEAMVDVNSATPAGESCLHVALRRCLPSMVELLLRFGADPGMASLERCGKQAPLHLAVELDQGPSIAMLLSFGADPNKLDAQKQTPLHIAARMGHVTSARMLIAHGANIVAEDGLGRTPLKLAEWAMKRSDAHAEIAEALMAALKEVYPHGGVPDTVGRMDDAAVAAAGGPIAVIAGGQACRLSGVMVQPSSQFMSEARANEAARISWTQTAVRRK